MKRESNGVKIKEFCRYAVCDSVTGIFLVCGEKYKVNQGLEYVASFRSLSSRFRKISTFARKAIIKGRSVDIVYWFNPPRRVPYRSVTEAGLIMGLR